MRTPLIVVTALGALALATPAEAVPGASPPAGSASASACAPPERPLFGLTRNDGRRTLARFEPRTLRPRRAPRVPVPLRVIKADSAFSPGCDAVALPVHRGRIVLVDLERGRRSGSITLGSSTAVTPMSSVLAAPVFVV